MNAIEFQKPTTQSFTFEMHSSKSSKELFEMLLNINQWWSGIFNEKISGNSNKIDDDFSFHAGDGVHYSKHRLIELIANERIVWEVTESNLNFIEKTDEWVGTTIAFELKPSEKGTTLLFAHNGLVPQLECYENCSAAWTQYMQNLTRKI